MTRSTQDNPIRSSVRGSIISYYFETLNHKFVINKEYLSIFIFFRCLDGFKGLRVDFLNRPGITRELFFDVSGLKIPQPPKL